MPATRKLLYLEDLHVGQRFVSGEARISEEEIKAFAREFDPQPFHLDHEAAKGTFFKGLAASGWHTAALTMRLNVDSGPPLAGGILGMGVELTWNAPTRPGDVLHVEGEVESITPSKSRADRGVVVLLNKTLNQRGEVVQTSRATLLVFRRPDAIST
jgi:acyl dehydratase